MEGAKFTLILLLVLAPIVFGAPSPYSMEDDEYDDDPELPDRKETMLKQQEEQAEREASADSSTTTTTSPRPHKLSANFPYPNKKWVQRKEVRGYHILSDGPEIQTELVKTRPMLRIRVEIPDTVRDVEKFIDDNKQYLELKIRNWNKVQKVHVKVPFGYQPEDLRVSEKKDHISIIAPIYSDVDENEYRNVPQIVYI